MKKNDVSVIICTKNSSMFIQDVIQSAWKHNPKEVIVVDAQSKDATTKIAKNLGCKVVFDSGVGLGHARNVGLLHAKSKYVFYLGPDNILKSGGSIFETLIKAMKHYQWDGIGLLSEVLAPTSYTDKGMALRWANKITAGEKGSIGTPFMFERKLLDKFRFNDYLKYSDDTELCERLTNAGRSVGYSHLSCWEVSNNNWKSLKARFKAYGLSDGEYYLKHCNQWDLKRRIKSILHPLTEFQIIKSLEDIPFIPFVICIVIFRYVGYTNKIYAGK